MKRYVTDMFTLLFPFRSRMVSKYPGRSWPGNGGYGIANFRQPRKGWRTTRNLRHGDWLGPPDADPQLHAARTYNKSDYSLLPGLFLVSFQSTCLHSLVVAHLSFSRTFRVQIIPPEPP